MKWLQDRQGFGIAPAFPVGYRLRVDTSNNDPSDGPQPVLPLEYRKKRSIEQRVENLERYIRLWMTMSIVMAIAALMMAGMLAMRVYEANR